VSTSFFVRANLNGMVEETYWSNPVSLAVPYVTSLEGLVDGPNRERLTASFSHAAEQEERIVCNQVVISEQSAAVCIFIYYSERHLWVLAVDYLHQLDGSAREKQDQVLFHLIRQFALLHKKNQIRNSHEISNHFEQIQKLNNELVNTHRKLQQANAQLEILNEELNNRLVKDPLTGLVSRYQYRSEIVGIIGEKPDALGVFAFIDIDNFKQVNDRYGHSVGDAYLVEFSKRLSAVNLAYRAIFMRIAGDEFGIYLHGLDDFDKSFGRLFWEQFSRRVTDQPINTQAGKLPISCSVGLAVYNRDTKNVYELIDYADWAMYLAKKSEKNTYRIFDKAEFVKLHAESAGEQGQQGLQ